MVHRQLVGGNKPGDRNEFGEGSSEVATKERWKQTELEKRLGNYSHF